MASNKGAATCITFMLVAIVLLIHAESGEAKCDFFFPRQLIKIWNDIGPGITVNVHCKSKNDDLGVHTVPYHKDYIFRFRPNIQGTTLFYCSASWNGRTEYFDAYDGAMHKDACGINLGCTCPWRLTPDGTCLWNKKTKQHDKCQPWKPKDTKTKAAFASDQKAAAVDSTIL